MQHAVFFDTNTDDMNDVLDAVERVYLATEGVGNDTPTPAVAAGAPLVIPASAPLGTQPMTQAAAAALVAAAPAAVQRDAEGLPHDARIHTEPAKLGKDGKWSAKRKLDAAFVAQVKAELLGTSAAPAATFQQHQQAAQTPAASSVPVNTGFTAPGAGGGFTAPTPTPAQLTGYQELVKLVGQYMLTPENPTGRFNKEWLQGGLTGMGVPNGQLEAVATLPDEQARQIVVSMKSALGI